MKARLTVELPFSVIVLAQQEYRIWAGVEGEYTITFQPFRASTTAAPAGITSVAVDLAPAFFANTAVIEFKKDEDFDRSVDAEDPPIELMNSALRALIERYRFVRCAPDVAAPVIPNCNWRLDYLRDDDSSLGKEEGKIRGRYGESFVLTTNVASQSVWDACFELPTGFRPPAWHTLLLDALNSVQHVGTAVVLTAVALEVFIGELLQNLSKDGPIPSDVWDWINKRDHWSKEPSVDEKFDQLLKALTGHSLKEDAALWESYVTVRRARNNFAHAGIVTTARKRRPDSPIVTVEEATRLIQNAFAITTLVRSWIPEHLRWPTFSWPEMRVDYLRSRTSTVSNVASNDDGSNASDGTASSDLPAQ